MAIEKRPRFTYNDGEAQDFTFDLAQRPWDFGSQGVGGSDASAAGVPASFEIRRDFFLHLTLRFENEEWEEVERLVRHFQAGGSATFYPDQLEVADTHTVYGVRPAMGEEIRPRRSGENLAILELNITLRRTTEAIFTDLYYAGGAFTFPIIEEDEFNWDASLQTEGDGDTVSPWVDQTANGNDATVDNGTPEFIEAGWNAFLPGIQLLNNENFVFDASVFHNLEMTYFLVFEATDISTDLPLIGSYSASSDPRYPSVFVRTDGRLVWTMSHDPYGCVTGTGVIETLGRYIVTARQSGTNGMDLRLNGVEVVASPSLVDPNVQAAPGSVGLCRDTITGGVGGNFFGTDKLFAQFLGYSKAASDDEVAQMEGFLGQKWDITI